MSVYLFTKLFYILLFLLMCGTLRGQVCASSGPPSPVAKDIFELFEKDKISNAKNPNGDTGEEDVEVNLKDYYSPVFVLLNDFFVALAGVNRKDEPKKNVDIITKYVNKNELLGEKDIAEINQWETQFAVQYNKINNNDDSFVKSLLAAVNNDKIYLFLMNYTKTGDSDLSNGYNFNFEFVVGEVKDKPAKQIVWTKKDELKAVSLANKLNKEFNEKPDGFFLGGSAFLTKEGNIMFVIVVEDAKKKKSDYADAIKK